MKRCTLWLSDEIIARNITAFEAIGNRLHLETVISFKEETYYSYTFQCADPAPCNSCPYFIENICQVPLSMASPTFESHLRKYNPEKFI